MWVVVSGGCMLRGAAQEVLLGGHVPITTQVRKTPALPAPHPDQS
jgi:hypothetical protein